MKGRNLRPVACALLLAGLLAAPVVSGEEETPSRSAQEVQQARHTRLEGRHFTADVELKIERAGRRENRRLKVWRDDEGAARERIMARFVAPPDLRNFGLLFVENQGRPNDYFIHQPELARVRRVSESVVSQDIYGVDLEFLGFGVAQSVPCEAEGVKVRNLDGRAVYELRERALQPNQRFEERITWVDAASLVPLRTEHIRGGKPVLIAKVEKLETVQGVPTPTLSTFERPGEDERVTMSVRKIDYETPIAPEFFSTLALIKK